MSNSTKALILAAAIYGAGALPTEYLISSRQGAYSVGWFVGVLAMMILRRRYKDLDERL